MTTPDDRTVDRIRLEFTAMPGLRLTAEQARRLWALDDRTCERLLGTLVAMRFLERDPDGRYVRQGASSQPFTDHFD